MELTEKQKKGLDLCIQRFRSGEKYTTIAGYAGSGKSTLVRFIVEALGGCGIDIDTDVAYTAFTGKAVQVMIDKGNTNAYTLHKLLYQSRPLPNGKFIHSPKSELEYKVIICDECGMAPKEMVDILLRHNVYVIFCGDNAQLPPVDKSQDNHLLDHPHVFLDQIMRQAADSGIIQLSMKIRNGENINNFKSDDVIVIPKSQLNTGMLEWADIILCATNATRKSINTQCRELKGYTEPIVENEKLICCSNMWDTISDKGNSLTNGCIGELTNIFEQEFHLPNYLKIKNNKIPIISGTFITNSWDNFGTLNCDKNYIILGDSYLSPQQKYSIGRSKKYQALLPYELTYAYAITTWKAQGSEFDKVLGIEENFPYNKEEHKKFLYTMCTRASSKFVLIRG